jgi:PAS domain S-box-containing protein
MATQIQQSIQLPEADAGFRAVFEHSAIGIVLAGLDGLPRMVNPAIVRMTGYSEQELLSMPGLDLSYPEDRYLAVHPIKELLQGGRSAFFRDAPQNPDDGRGIDRHDHRTDPCWYTC